MHGFRLEITFDEEEDEQYSQAPKLFH